MKLILLGASGHGRVVADIVRCQSRFVLKGFVDDDPTRPGTLGTSSILKSLLSQGVAWAIVSIGSNSVRMKKAHELEAMGFQLATAVHPSSILAQDISVGSGSVIMPGAIINCGTFLGKNVIINTAAGVDHDCVIEDGAHISPGVRLAGGVRVGKEAHVGIGVSVIPGVRIGSGSTVGAGAVVIRDVPDGIIVAGNPAKPIRREIEA